MSTLGLQLKCHQLINQINDVSLNSNILQIVNALGGIRVLLVNNLSNIASQTLANILNNIRLHENNNDNNDANGDVPDTLTTLPREMIAKVSQYLEISEIKCLAVTCIDLRLTCESELNKIDIRLVTYEDLMLQYKLTFEDSHCDTFGKIVRVNKGLTIGEIVRKIYKSKNYYAFWNAGIGLGNPVFPITFYCDLSKIVGDIASETLKFAALNYEVYLTPMTSYNLDNLLILIKYFDVQHQKLYNIDIVRIQQLSQLTSNMVLYHVKTELIQKYSEIFKSILKYKDTLNDSNNFQFYQQRGFAPNDIGKIFLNGKVLSNNVIIFELNVHDNASNKIRFKDDVISWKQKLNKQNIPFSSNVITFWSYNYDIYKTKKKYNFC